MSCVLFMVVVLGPTKQASLNQEAVYGTVAVVKFYPTQTP